MLNFPRWKVIVISLVSLLGILAAVPNFFTEEQLKGIPSFLPSKQVTLGLDLQGGAHLLMEVEMGPVLEDRLQDKSDEIRDALIAEKIRHRRRIRDGKIIVTLNNPAQQEQAISQIKSEAAAMVGASLTSIGTDDISVTDMGNGIIEVALTEGAIKEYKRLTVGQSVEIVRRRIDEMGTKEPSIQQNGEDRVLIQVPGIDNPDELKDILGKTAKLEFRLVDQSVSPDDIARGRVPPGTEIVPPSDEDAAAGAPSYAVRKRAILSGENLVDASQGFDQNGQPAVNFRFDSAGGKKFADVTRKNVGKPFAIVLDNKVISAPRINSPILGGSGIITGNFSIDSANELAMLLRAGALPAPLKVLEERTVGPDLGADSIAAGEVAAIIGLAAVMIYILLSYGWFGVVANTALVVNIFMILGLLSTIGATLTLPGIAGIVLTIGMAVDANVLIFERIREELRNGRNALSALDMGYQKAFSTILDANVTTLIAALILFQFGSGPVKGFAVTLACGIFTSVFTAVSLSRLILATWARKRRPTTFKI
ncbi:protein translocase subunit SecD [Emcibacter nanhaiensis]|uniref:Protein translocase subunit SecD n=1 Tax=Emcibacter nanhaiensis TaxID=1505037 RepID=A0A501PSU3_9PROT|nr:protein translocase subunit SecD [Emcibacter nanhaiensis]TPD63122.1 protein translocase subunit SecD [Emcibacter nanhaiensis]